MATGDESLVPHPPGINDAGNPRKCQEIVQFILFEIEFREGADRVLEYALTKLQVADA